MARLPVTMRGGGLAELLEALESGTADPEDQRFAAKLLRVGKIPSPYSEEHAQRWRDWSIYWAVRSHRSGEVGLNEASRRTARDLAARQGEPGSVASAYRYVQQGERVRPLSWQRVKRIYLDMESLSEQLDGERFEE